jgi:CubicO group peptidase (beta-lactamase class C family)
MKHDHLPSAAVILVDDQQTIWQETFGTADMAQDLPASTDTVYKQWSVAKVFTAIEVMRLVEEGLVDLDAPITDTLPEFSIHSRFKHAEPITIRSLLTHRSGLPRNECRHVPFSEQALAELVASLEDCHQAYPVDYRYKYSNIAFDLLGYLIQELRGEPFPDTMRENLFSLLGMHSSAFLRAQVPEDLLVAPGYEYYQGEYYLYEQDDTTSLPSGNLYSTIEDMGRFVKFILRGGEANGKQVLTPGSLAEMFADQASTVGDPQPMGLGWKTAQVLGSEQLVWHDGGPGEGVGSLVALLPERKLGVVLIANSTSFEGRVSLPLALDFLEVLLEAKYGLQIEPAGAPPVITIDPGLLEEYAGRYAAFGDVLEITRRGNHLVGSSQGISFNLLPVSETTFQLQHWLFDLGLAGLLRVPFDLREMKISFHPADESGEDRLIISFGELFFETCPWLPDFGAAPGTWMDLVGEYDVYARLPAGDRGSLLGGSRIWVEEAVFKMAGMHGPISPISETEIIILSGPFAGEVMVREADAGRILHQGMSYQRK